MNTKRIINAIRSRLYNRQATIQRRKVLRWTGNQHYLL